MTRLALAVLVWSPCVVLLADEPKKQPSEFEGTWQEPTRPGEDATVRYRITFAGETVTIHHRDQVLSGTFAVNSKSDPITISMTITEVKGDGSHTKGTYRGIYEIGKTRVSLHFNPVPVGVPESGWFPHSEAEPPRKIEIRGPDGKIQQLVAPAVGFQKRGMGLAPVTLTLHKVKK